MYFNVHLMCFKIKKKNAFVGDLTLHIVISCSASCWSLSYFLTAVCFEISEFCIQSNWCN